MYKVLVADDETIIREGICEMIPWKELGTELYGTAEDGKDALEKVRQLHPAIVLTDIQMPFINGIDLIKKIKQEDSDCLVAIITGHDEFEYARSAIQLGVCDYIVKPIDIGILCDMIRKMVHVLDEKFNQKNQLAQMKEKIEAQKFLQRQHLFSQYLFKRISAEKFVSEMSEPIDTNGFFGCVILQIDNFDNITCALNEEEIFLMTQHVEEVLRRILCDNDGKIPTFIEEPPGRFVTLVMANSISETEQLRNSLIKKLRIFVKDYSFTTSSSDVFFNLAGFTAAYEQAKEILHKSFLMGTNKDLTNSAEYSKLTLSGEFDVRWIIKSISSFDKKKIKQDFEMAEQEIRQAGKNSFLFSRMIVSFVYAEIIKLLAEMQMPIQDIVEDHDETFKRILNYQTLESMMQSLYAFVVRICDYLAEQKVNSTNMIVEKAKLFIRGSYTESKLTLETVADHLSVSPNYLSILFRPATGQSFISYLTEVRIEHAKKLLSTGKYHACEVGYMCGYENPTYFSTIFKKHTGVSPSEYR